MARVRMVTRTVEVTVVSVMQLNTETAEVATVTRELSGIKYDSEVDILKALNSDLSNPVKSVAVKSITHKEVLYGMPEADFIAHATILPPRTTTED